MDWPLSCCWDSSIGEAAVYCRVATNISSDNVPQQLFLSSDARFIALPSIIHTLASPPLKERFFLLKLSKLICNDALTYVHKTFGFNRPPQLKILKLALPSIITSCTKKSSKNLRCNSGVNNKDHPWCLITRWECFDESWERINTNHD